MFEINTVSSERLLEHEGIPVIRLTVETPVVSGGKARASRRINAFYGHIADAVEKHLRHRMLKRAAADFNDALEKSRPFEPYRVKMTFEAGQNGEDEALEIKRRLYTRTHGGDENEYSLTEKWNARLGLPDKLGQKPVSYSLLVE